MADYAATVDPMTFRLLAAVASAADATGTPWMIAGASARIILLEQVYGLQPGRATEDLDFAVLVQDWAHFERLSDHICRDDRFGRDPKQAQRIRHREGGFLDLVPFGGVEAGDRSIAWPPDGDIVMSVAGFKEAFGDAIPVLVNGTIAAPVASPAGLFLLKLVAWAGRGLHAPNRDAADLAYLLRHASDIIGLDVLYDRYLPEVQAVDYDVQFAAARVLGQRVATLAKPALHTKLYDLLAPLDRDGADAALVGAVARHLEASEEHVLELFRQLKQGIDSV